AAAQVKTTEPAGSGGCSGPAGTKPASKPVTSPRSDTRSTGLKVSKTCPSCGARRYRAVKLASRKGSGYRICLECGTPYLQPASILLAVGLIAFGLMIGLAGPWFLLLGLLCVVIGLVGLLNRPLRADPANAQSDSTVIVRPRPDLASATRRWPQLVMASQGTELKLVFGYMIALLVGMS